MRDAPAPPRFPEDPRSLPLDPDFRDPRHDPKPGDLVLPPLATPHRVLAVFRKPGRESEPEDFAVTVEYRPGGLMRTRECSLRQWRAIVYWGAVLHVEERADRAK
jgi:hypothetical protein